MTPHEQAHAEHMERVRAVHRRSAFERAICKLAYFDNWERRAAAGDEPPMDERRRAQHQYVRELVSDRILCCRALEYPAVNLLPE